MIIEALLAKMKKTILNNKKYKQITINILKHIYFSINIKYGAEYGLLYLFLFAEEIK